EASNSWRQSSYNGASPHTEHAHFSSSYETAREADTSSWHLDELRKDDDVIPVKKGDSGEAVKFWQLALVELGFGPLQADGEYGPLMEKAVNAYRAKHAPTSGTTPQITGWHAFHMIRALAAKYAGKPGADGKPGKDGTNGTLTGTLTVTSGEFKVKAGA
ncbi:peptidoglycan-binding domain-containing protein, partial [Actinoplanes rectilineatus]|uniref:peptidoglycan-binding domain-containing protein n=1 Tax=Actinoplanes rectilineatus TaxID=113571 RepID=UPI0005F293FF